MNLGFEKRKLNQKGKGVWLKGGLGGSHGFGLNLFKLIKKRNSNYKLNNGTSGSVAVLTSDAQETSNETNENSYPIDRTIIFNQLMTSVVEAASANLLKNRAFPKERLLIQLFNQNSMASFKRPRSAVNNLNRNEMIVNDDKNEDINDIEADLNVPNDPELENDSAATELVGEKLNIYVPTGLPHVKRKRQNAVHLKPSNDLANNSQTNKSKHNTSKRSSQPAIKFKNAKNRRPSFFHMKVVQLYFFIFVNNFQKASKNIFNILSLMFCLVFVLLLVS